MYLILIIFIFNNHIMNTSTLLSQIIGPFFIITAFSLIINTSNYKKMLKNIWKEPLLLYLSGFISFVIGMLIIVFHNIWESNWYILITILWYLATIKWIWLIMFPDFIVNFSKKSLLKKSVLKSIWLLYLFIGFYISYLWFFN